MSGADDTIRGVAEIFVVTGGAGFIGSHVVERLLADHPTGRVRVFDDFSSGSMANLPFAAAAGERLEVLRGDVRDLAAGGTLPQTAPGCFNPAGLPSGPCTV